MGGNIEIQYNNKSINNYVDLRKREDIWKLLYKLRTPRYTDKETLVTEMTYANNAAYHNMT